MSLKVKYTYETCALGFYWLKDACINLADVWTLNLFVHSTCLDYYHFVSQIAYKC